MLKSNEQFDLWEICLAGGFRLGSLPSLIVNRANVCTVLKALKEKINPSLPVTTGTYGLIVMSGTQV